MDDKTDSLRAVWLDCNYWQTVAISAAPFTAQQVFSQYYVFIDWFIDLSEVLKPDPFFFPSLFQSEQQEEEEFPNSGL